MIVLRFQLRLVLKELVQLTGSYVRIVGSKLISCTGISAQYILYKFVEISWMSMCYFKWLILRFSDLGVEANPNMLFFCYRALLYNFVIKFQYRCLSDLV